MIICKWLTERYTDPVISSFERDSNLITGTTQRLFCRVHLSNKMFSSEEFNIPV